MSKSIRIIQNLHEHNVNPAFVNKLYEMLNYNDEHPLNPILDVDHSNFVGEITLNGASYKEYVDAITDVFNDLTINVSTYYILFTDDNIKQALMAGESGTGSNGCGDGTGITKAQAAIFNIGGIIFRNNTNIGDFPEFKYFTYSNKTNTAAYMFMGSSLTSIDMSEFTNNISPAMFCGCTNLTTLSAPLVVQVGQDGICSCSNLTSISLPSCTTLNNSAFRDNPILTTINIPNVTSIGREAFKNDTAITTLNIDWTKVTSILPYAFQNANIPDSVDSVTLSSYTGTLQEYVFLNCIGITSFTGSQITSTNKAVFENCKSLTSADLPNCTSLGVETFYGCTELTTVNIPNVVSIGNNCFCGDKKITTLNIDWTKIKVIDENIFKGCTNLGIGETVDLNLTEQTSYPALAFENTKYKKLIIHMQLGAWNGIIGNYDTRYPIHAGMVQLEYLDYSDSNIINWAPLYLSNDDANIGHMNTMIWPATITHVDWRWHMYMPNLQYFIILVEDPYQMDITGSGASYLKGGGQGRIPSTCNIYVKDSTVRDAYLAHEFWGTIPNANTRIKILAELPVGVWTTGLYQQYEPYLSHSNDPVYS